MNSPSGWSQLTELLDQHGAALELYAAQWTNSPADCVQEAFIRLSVYMQQHDDIPDHPGAWLYRVVRNQALNSARAQRRRDHYERIAARLTEKRSVEEHDAARLVADDKQQLIESVDRLPAQQREIVVLRIWSELTWQEIADLTSTSSSSAQRTYVAALAKLRQKLEQPCLPNTK